MAYPTISSLPPAPLLSDTPQDFDAKAVSFTLALNPLVSQLNAAGEFVEASTAQVGSDATQVAADRDQTTADASATAADRVQTTADAAATASDRVQTGEDRVQTGQDRLVVVEARDTTLGYRDEAQSARDEAVAIAAGDVAITDLQPGTLIDEGDFVTVDEGGALVKRSLRDGSQAASLSRYDVAGVAATNVLDLNVAMVFEVDNTSPLNLSMINFPSSGRSETIVVDVQGSAGLTFNVPDGITLYWSDGAQPEPANNWMQFIFIYTGSRLRGGVGLSA